MTHVGQQRRQRQTHRRVQAVLDTMQKHPTAEGLLEHACAALRGLSINNDNRRRIAEAGGIRVVLDKMRRHPLGGGVFLHRVEYDLNPTSQLDHDACSRMTRT